MQDWKNKVIEKIDESHKLTDALSQHFILENQIAQLNQISEVMFKVCEGKQLNKLIEFMDEKLNFFAKKK